MLVATGTQESKLTDLSRAYEIRAFGLQAELRWTREGRTGEAIALADGHVAALGDPDPTHGQALDILARRYRVWGKPVRKERDATPSVAADADLAAAAPPRGWTTLSAGRIGSLCVPLAIGGNDEVVLEAREYVTLGEGGNAVVLFERLVRFAPAGEKE
ncbi:MAG: CRISPR-associated protein Csx19 [Xanthobacteraceae bacterium]|nr:CRISPR-associated protein Csx19 [Xanthobacteraceae bacterium]